MYKNVEGIFILYKLSTALINEYIHEFIYNEP